MSAFDDIYVDRDVAEGAKAKVVIAAIDVDKILWYAGSFGRFQVILLILFSIINFLSAFHYFGQTFLSIEPVHKCKTPDANLSLSVLSSCAITVRNDGGIIEKPCTEWNYNNSYGYISLVQELNWVCHDDWKANLGQSVFFVGSLVGSLAFGILADRIGRLHVLVVSNCFAAIGNLVTIYSRNVIGYAVSRFLAGCATDTNFVMMYMIVMEYVDPKMRTCGLNLTIGIFYCMASMVIPWIAVWTRHWTVFLVAISVPHAIVLLYYLVLPESAQWLISRNRFDEAVTSYKKIAKINRREIGDDKIEQLRVYANDLIKDTYRQASFLSLLRTPKLRKKALILIFKSMILNLCYDAIARDVNGMQFTPFVIFTATSATIFPGCLVVTLLQDRIGRKALASSSLLLGGICICIVGSLVALCDSAPLFNLGLTILARFNIIIAYNSGSQYTFELIPTEVRAQGVSVIHVAGFVATFFSPQVLYLSKFWKPLPEIILGILLAIGAIACLFLPETLNRTLPVTLEDGEDFGEDEGIFQFGCYKPKRTESKSVLTPISQL